MSKLFMIYNRQGTIISKNLIPESKMITNITKVKRKRGKQRTSAPLSRLLRQAGRFPRPILYPEPRRAFHVEITYKYYIEPKNLYKIVVRLFTCKLISRCFYH